MQQNTCSPRLSPLPALLTAFTMLLLASSPALARSYTLPGTGQTACYDNVLLLSPCPTAGQPFYGQDGNYPGSPPAYAASGEVVADTVTGLGWQKADDGVSRYLEEARAYCEGLTLGGYSDWRLPTRMELLTIVDASRAAPATNPVFTSGNGKYWTTTLQAGDASEGWSVRFSDGLASYDGISNPYLVRCVRGPAL
ncbi:DUF1566 domain-containing protein [Desulfovibrio sulfodismutans]|uniref:DUF1566 domain-containing protein n=2 Tax=Desulfolutivibrio sulfodismutans TaxID=63561 RepID=A0A7K3NIT3_9BACT|nr:DUF1566 domain-containing protein [Desulfolutivibrio sulfodismutans]NDY55129.1 DUF1566 domain-containing protein [Desulfolutivibrio sulfodismutans]